MASSTSSQRLKNVNVYSISFQDIIYSDFNNSYTQITRIRKDKWQHMQMIDLIDMIILPLNNDEINERFPFYNQRE